MSEEKKKPTRRSVKKDVEKSRAKNAKKNQAKNEKAEKKAIEKHEEKPAKKPATKPSVKKTVVNNPIAEKSRAKDGKKKRGDTSTRLRWPQVVLTIFLVIIVGMASLFAWDRWMRYDDAQDFKGEWIYTSEGSSVPVSIDADRIAFSSDVKFPYRLDTWGKTVDFSFTDLSGGGVYRFSLDRQTLYIAEDASEDIFVSIQVSLGLVEPSEGFDLSKTTVLTRQAPIEEALPEEVVPEGGVSPEPAPEEGLTEEGEVAATEGVVE
ncbi:MAG: hypothetical protein ACOYD7_06555 [Raoultibacter sp.]|jgi:hypothetical protein